MSHIVPDKPAKVFLDANVVIRAGKPPGGPLIARVIDLVRAGFITILTTDLTKTEVAKRHAGNDNKVSMANYQNSVMTLS